MAVLKLTQFGGILPSVETRDLPDDAAQTAHNLDLRYGDHRPLRDTGESVATVDAGTHSIFRTPSGVWLSSVYDVDYVNGQINDAESERVYLTGRSTYPEAWQDATYRRLGVPRPTVAAELTPTEVGEFTDTELEAARPGVLAAIKAAILDNLGTEVLGHDPSPTTPTGGGGGDPLANFVELHLRFDGTPGTSDFVDSSKNLYPVVPGTVTIASGSGLTGGNQVASFTGGRGLDVPGVDAAATQDWAVEFYATASVNITQLGYGNQSGSLSKLRYNAASRSFFQRKNRNSSDKDFSIALGAPILAGTLFKVQVINRAGLNLQFVIDGVPVGTANNLALNVGHIGWDPGGVADPHQGTIEEFRVTVGALRTADATLAVFPDASPPAGFWLPHGTSTSPSLPTSKEGDWNYMVSLTLLNGAYVPSSPLNTFFNSPAFRSRRVTYMGAEYLAVPMAYQAIAKPLNYAAAVAALTAILNPDDGVSQLIPDATIATMATAISDRLDPTKEPVLGYATDIDAKETVVDTQVVSTDSSASRATQMLTSIAELEAATKRATDYYSVVQSSADDYVLGLYVQYVESVLPTTVVRRVESRAYVYTYVTDWGEESAPSPASELIDVDQNDTVTVVPTYPPVDRNVVGWRLYRSSTTNVGAAYQLVEDKDAVNAILDNGVFDYFDIEAALTYTDAKKQAELQETLQTLTWVEPPSTLKGLVGLPNGIMAGFFGKTVCFSEPFAPYAWPIEYQLTTEHNIVGLGVFGQTLVVLTEGYPYYASAADSASMSLQKIESTQSCVAKRTIVNMEGGTVYASPDGLCIAGPSGISLLTEGAYAREDWQLLEPQTRRGGFHEGVYYLVPDTVPPVPAGAGPFSGVEWWAIDMDFFTDQPYDTFLSGVYGGGFDIVGRIHYIVISRNNVTRTDPPTDNTALSSESSLDQSAGANPTIIWTPGSGGPNTTSPTVTAVGGSNWEVTLAVDFSDFEFWSAGVLQIYTDRPGLTLVITFAKTLPRYSTAAWEYQWIT